MSVVNLHCWALMSFLSQALKRRMKGLFIAYAISDAYLRQGGVIDVESVDFKGAMDRYSLPKVTIQEMPRLSTMLRDSFKCFI